MSFHVRSIREEKERPSALAKLIERMMGVWRSVAALRVSLRARKEEEQEEGKRAALLRTTATVLVSILCALLVLAGAFKALTALKILSISGLASIAGSPPPQDEHGFTNVLILGEGNSDHEGQYLTDTLMIGSIDAKKTNSAVMLSLPRDLYVLQTEKMGAGRINSLYRNYMLRLRGQGKNEADASRESLSELAKEIGTIVGLQMHGVVKINFSGFEQAIDAIGGIDVEVKEDIVDTQYPGPNYSYVTFALSKGMQHLDGATALKYARSRHSTSDFSRSARQQQIIAAAIKKVTDSGMIKNASRITELLSIVSKNVETTLGTRELIGLASLGKQIDGRMVSMQINDQAGLYGGLSEPGGFLYAPPREEFEGASVLLPVSVPPFPVTWKQINTLGHLLFVNRDLYLSPPSIAVLNNKAKEGMGRRLGGELIRYGFNIVAIRNYDKELVPPTTDSFVAVALPVPKDGSNDERERLNRMADFLATTLKIKRQDFAGPQPFTSSPQIVVVLGKDYTYTPLQDILSLPAPPPAQ